MHNDRIRETGNRLDRQLGHMAAAQESGRSHWEFGTKDRRLGWALETLFLIAPGLANQQQKHRAETSGYRMTKGIR
jgi:hypothetical protein